MPDPNWVNSILKVTPCSFSSGRNPNQSPLNVGRVQIDSEASTGLAVLLITLVPSCPKTGVDMIIHVSPTTANELQKDRPISHSGRRPLPHRDILS